MEWARKNFIPMHCSAATQPSKLIIWKCTWWFTVERSLLFANSATTPAQQLVSSRDTCSPTRERSLLFAHSAATPPQQLVTSRRICKPIQEKRLLAEQSVIIAAQQLAASKHTCFHSGENLSAARSVNSPAQQYLTSRNTFRREAFQVWLVQLFMRSS